MTRKFVTTLLDQFISAAKLSAFILLFLPLRPPKHDGKPRNDR